MTTIPTEKPKKSNEWYTPAKYSEAAREVMGGNDLDPASCALANQTVQAAQYYTIDDDGLSKPWHGRVWLNPPYSYTGVASEMNHTGLQHSIVHQWISRLIAHYKGGQVSEAVLLTKADPKQCWFAPLWDYLICFAFNRVYFDRPGLPPERVMFGTVFVYLGPNEAQFTRVFSQLGTVARRVTP